MKGIILSGGHGTRLYPLTKVTSKQLLPIYDKPMIFYPLQKLLDAGIRDILIIVAPDHCGDYMKVLGSGREFGAKFTYEIQDKPEGLAQAYIVGEDFIGTDSVCMILGDNLFDADITDAVQTFKSGGRIFAKEVPDPERLGQVKFDESGKVLQIEEKAVPAISNYGIPGIYIFDNRCIQAAKEAKPSARGEYEITEIHNWYLKRGELDVKVLEGDWLDAGTFETLFKAQVWAERNTRNK
ncbi:MAG TPA: sugar phosphate nucleotidyltransferase [Patescibacteria group bacterium]|nr:sugar phosphate nucleotidyltransferase [Patescibacteria group bacterium]